MPLVKRGSDGSVLGTKGWGTHQPLLSFHGEFTWVMSRNPISKVCIPSAPSQSCPDVPQHPPKLKGDIGTQRAAGSLQPGTDIYLYQAGELMAAQLDLKACFIFSFLFLC